MNTASLREFLLSVPTCVETRLLVEVWQSFQTGHDQVVVVDDQYVPLGVLSAHQWLQYLSTDILPEKSPSSGQPVIATERNSMNVWNRIDFSQSSFNLAGTTDSVLAYLEPVASAPDDWTLEQFRPYLRAIGQQWVLVNSSGQYVGLLDRLRLLQFLTTAFASPVATERSAETPELRDLLRQAQGHQAHNHQTHNHQAHSHQAEADKATQLLPALATMTHAPAIDPLIDLLERIPIPLMLQTSTGRIITQNLFWRQQVSDLQDPGQLGREAAMVLESMEWGESDLMDDGMSPIHHSQSIEFEPTESFQAGRRSRHVSPRHTGICRLSNEPNGCVCVCPMKNGQDRIWKFLKVPMGLTTAPDNPDLFPTDGEAVPQFKLATLGFSPDPDWRSLAQTEFLWLILAHDITEQHQIARELAAKNADLVQLNRLKDEFLSCISHELKTPLTAVLGLSSLLKDQALGKLNERQSRYARLIHQSGRHLISIVNDILDLTRIETGQLALALESVRIETVAQNAYHQAQQLHAVENNSEPQVPVPDADTGFQLEIQEGLGSLVADELRLRQMLCNLLSNALKFTEPGGEIGLRVENWEGWIAFTVWDTGIGIPVDKQHLIFQKFQQLENPLTRQFEGTGLGLVLTQRLARLHGGDITFTSSEGEGSQFTLLLPPSPPQTTAEMETGKISSASACSPNLITSRNRLMLIVEAAPKRIEDLSHRLLGLGYRVAIARSGTEALEKIRRLQPAAVFLNPILPLLSGWDVLTLLKVDEETCHIPVVVTATRAEREQTFQNGANAFLSLPIRTEALQQCIDRLIEQGPELSDESTPSITVLYLNSMAQSVDVSSSASTLSGLRDLTSLLHPHRCRVLEVEDLEQADLLAQVWKPNVILLDGEFPNASAYLKQLSSHPSLAALPIVTLTVEITHAANLISGLSVFPCLASAETQPLGELRQQTSHQQTNQLQSSPDQNSDQNPDQKSVSALWQVIQMAAGIHWTPHILIADVSTLEAQWSQATPSDLHQQIQPDIDTSKLPNAMQALVQYMQIAGFRSSVGHSWQQVVQQLQHHSVDLLLFCVSSSSNLHPLFLEIIQTIEQLATKPVILVWNCRSDATHARSNNETEQFAARWGTIATEILPASLSMPDLLTRISQTLVNR